MGIASPLEYLLTSSEAALETFELARLNKSANLRKELRDVVEEWIEAEIQSRLARWILDSRRTQAARSDANLSGPSASPSAKTVAANLLLPFDDLLNSQEFRSEPASVKQIPTRSTRDRRDSPPVPSTQLSDKAKDALKFLERQVRSQADAANVHKSPAEAGRNAASSRPAQNDPPRRRLPKSSRTASLLPAAPDSSDGVRSARPQTRRFAARNPAKRDAPKPRAAAGLSGSADAAHIAPLARSAKLQPSAPVRASMRFSPHQRRAV
jgi:hypothetical protein